MRTYKVAAMGGDGIGPEVVDAGVQVSGVCAERNGRVHPGLPGLRLGFGLLPETWRDDAGRRRRPAPQVRRHPVRRCRCAGHPRYWRVATSQEIPDVLEIRRAEGGIRNWAAEPGEYFHALDGSYGGLWRRNGRPPQMPCGVGFSAQGLFEGSYYRRMPSAADPRAAWIFQGIEDEIIGDFGLSGGGAAGFELDRADLTLGTPPNALILARSEGHQSHFGTVPEELLSHLATLNGERPKDLIRAEIVYFETTAGGAVFSTGTITFCASLSHNNYDNNVSRMVENVLRPVCRRRR
jgi:N,N-dimethylformamidase